MKHVFKIVFVFALILFFKSSYAQTCIDIKDTATFETCVSKFLKTNSKLNSYKNKLLLQATKKGSLTTVLQLLKAGADPNSKDKHGTNSLMYASMNGDVDIIKALISAKANLDFMDSNNSTALMYASIHNQVKAIQVLIEAGAAKDTKNKDDETALMLAIWNGQTEAVKKLLELGVDPNTTYKSGYTALMRVSSQTRPDQTELIYALISAGANVDQTDKWNLTALFRATMKNQVSAVKILLENKANPGHQDKNGTTPLMVAAEKGYIDLVKLLSSEETVNLQNDSGKTALVIAIFYADVDIMPEIFQILLSKGADPNTMFTNDQTILEYVKFFLDNSLSLISAGVDDPGIIKEIEQFIERFKKVKQMLIEAGATE